MWDVVPKVATPFALAAFLVGAALVVLRSYLRRRADLIRLAPPADRAKLIDEVIADYGIRAENLTREQRYQLVLKGLEGRAARFRTSAVVLIIIAALLAGVVVFAIASRSSSTTLPSGSTPTASVGPSGPNNAEADRELPSLPANSAPPQLQFEVLARHAGQDRFAPLRSGDLLASGVDAYVMYARPRTAGYLYVFQVDSSGHCEWFYPTNPSSRYSSGSNPVNADADMLVPPRVERRALILDDVVGEERFYAVLSAVPWEQLEAALANANQPKTRPSAGPVTAPNSALDDLKADSKPRGTAGTTPIDTEVTFGLPNETVSLNFKGTVYTATGGAVVIQKLFRHVRGDVTGK